MNPHPRQRLTPIVIRKLRPGRHADGGGLYLLVEPSGAMRWVLRVVVDGRRRDIGLGGYSSGWEPKPGTDVLTDRLHPGSIAAARREAARMRAVARAGGDPLAARTAERTTARAKRKTFRDYATDYIANHRSEWKNDKHAAQWTSTLTKHVYPVFGDRTLGEIDTTDVVAALRPIWTKTPETASRLRARIETILDAAKAEGLRTGDNPAVWAGGLQASLPRDRRKQRISHHPALPYRAVAAFLVDLQAQPGTAAKALRFAILTAARTNEVIGARWSEIDREESLWIIPKARMKAGKEHRVALSSAALAVLDGLSEDGGLIFPGRGDDAMMSNMAMLQVLKRMGRDDITVHGFRSTFRDWAGEQTHHAREVIEHALSHKLADESEAAYQRGDLLQKRRVLMQDWAVYCATPRPATADVVPIRKTTAA